MTTSTIPSLSPEDEAFLAETFQRNRTLFAGWLMEDEGEAADESADEPAGDEPAGDEVDEADADASEDDGEDEDTGTELSREDAIAALKKVRKSEANYRTRLREATEALKAAKTPEEFEAALKEIESKSASDAHNMLKENVALRHGLPDELAELLKGDTRDELDAHAKVLKKFAPVEQQDDPELEGGLRPGSDDSDDTDISGVVNRVRANRY